MEPNRPDREGLVPETSGVGEGNPEAANRLASVQWWSDLKAAARTTPQSRDRYVDFLRLAAISAVVIGHWLTPAPYLEGEVLGMDHLLKFAPWSRWLTWLFQVMPVFFFVGGYANSASWQSAMRQGSGFATWLGGRLTRLVIPLIPLILFWVVAGLVATALQDDLQLFSEASQLALIPVWFLAVYILVAVVTPMSWECWRRFGLWSVGGLVAGAMTCDALALWLDATWIRWANYGFIWLAVHQLGFAWRDRCLDQRVHALILAATGLAGLAVLTILLSYPVSMVTVPGAAMSNSRPPSTALLALAMLQIGSMLVVAPWVRTLLRREAVWALVIAGNRFIMTLFLWHVTALVSCIGLAWLFGGLGLHLLPGSSAWWWGRLPWLLAAGTATAGFIGLLSRLERNAKPGKPASSVAEQVTGAAVTCGGLVFLALGGIVSSTNRGIALPPVAAAIAGIGLIIHANYPPLAARRPK